MHLSRVIAIFTSLAIIGSGAATGQDTPWKSFSEVTKGADAASGIFTIYTKRDNAYLALTPVQLDRDYLLVTQLSQGIGELGSMAAPRSIRPGPVPPAKATGSSSGW